MGNAFVMKDCVVAAVPKKHCAPGVAFSSSRRRRIQHRLYSNQSPVVTPNVSSTADDNPMEKKQLQELQQHQKNHSVRWTTASGTIEFEAWDGEVLRTAALRRGMVSPHNGKATLINCRGLGTCGTCAVEVAATRKTTNGSSPSNAAAAVEPKERNRREEIRLSLPPHNKEDEENKSLRLACQIQVRGDIDVVKRSGFWGQSKNTLSSSSGCETYFGNLEFLLDDKSPKEPSPL